MYRRKGSRGLSQKRSLRAQYNYYRKRYVERLAYEQAFKEARGAGTIEGMVKSLFKPQTFDELFEKGITRKRKGITVRVYGEEAVRLKIQSLKRRSSKSELATQYINNYTQAMKKAGYSGIMQLEVRKMLNNLSVDRLTYLLHEEKPRGLPSIEYLYEYSDGYEQKVDLVKQIREVIGLSKDEYGEHELKVIRARTKVLKKYQLEKMKLFDDIV